MGREGRKKTGEVREMGGDCSVAKWREGSEEGAKEVERDCCAALSVVVEVLDEWMSSVAVVVIVEAMTERQSLCRNHLVGMDMYMDWISVGIENGIGIEIERIESDPFHESLLHCHHFHIQ